MGSDRVEFGIRLPVAGPLASPTSIRAIARLAEDLGFDALWVHDYIVWTKELDRTHVSCGAVEMLKGDPEPLFYESLITLSHVAALTSTIKIGVAVLILPYRNPIVAAKQVATLDALSGGRLILGVGVGAKKSTRNQDFEVLGVKRSEKYALFREYAAVMKEIWTDPYPSFQGDSISFPETEINPKPVQKPYPPLWLGGAGEQAVELVAEVGDGWVPAWLTPDDFRRRGPEVRAMARAKGRDRPITLASEIVTCLGRTADEVDRLSDLTVRGFTQGFTVRTHDQAMEASLIGTPDQVCKRIGAFVDAGVRHFEMKPIYPTVDSLVEQLKLFSGSVLPSFR